MEWLQNSCRHQRKVQKFLPKDSRLQRCSRLRFGNRFDLRSIKNIIEIQQDFGTGSWPLVLEIQDLIPYLLSHLRIL